MKLDLYDVINARDREVKKLREQISKGEATENESYMVQMEYEKEIQRILQENARFDY